MKLFFSNATTVIAAALFVALPAAGSATYVDDDHNDSLSFIGDNDFFWLKSKQLNACIEPLNGRANRNGQSMILAACDFGGGTANIGWRFETSGDAKLFRASGNAGDTGKCLQAGGDAPNAVVSGTKIRIYPCDSTNRLQRFVGQNGSIRLESRTDLCVSWRGTTANIGKDPIILVSCDKLDEDRAAGWIAA